MSLEPAKTRLIPQVSPVQRMRARTHLGAIFVLLVTSAVGRLLIGWLIASLPLLFFLEPPANPYLFVFLFGLATGADFLLAALLAADHFVVQIYRREHRGLREFKKPLRAWPLSGERLIF